MKNLSKLVLAGALAASFLGTSVMAEDVALEPRHEIVLGVNTMLGIGGLTTGGDLYTDLDDAVILSVSGNYEVALLKFLQLGVSTTLSHLSTSAASATIFQLAGGPTFNIPFSNDWLYHSLFLGAKFGFRITDGTGSATDAILLGDIGYRAKLAEHVTWRPSIGFIKTLDGSKFLFAARPISFSFVF